MCLEISTCREIPTPFLFLNAETALFSVLSWLLRRERMVRARQAAARYPYSHSDSGKEKHQPPWLTVLPKSKAERAKRKCESGVLPFG